LTRDRPITRRFPSGFAVYPPAFPARRIHLVMRHSNKRQLLEIDEAHGGNLRKVCAVPARTSTESFPILRFSAERAIDKIDIMKITKNIGMLLLALYLIVDGLLGFGLNIGPAIFLLYIVALAAGLFILIGK
jgi:hypothetical protein